MIDIFYPLIIFMFACTFLCIDKYILFWAKKGGQRLEDVREGSGSIR